MVYYQMNEKQVSLLGRVVEKAITDYQIKGTSIPVESLFEIIEDLYHEIDLLEEKNEGLQEDISILEAELNK